MTPHPWQVPPSPLDAGREASTGMTPAFPATASFTVTSEPSEHVTITATTREHAFRAVARWLDQHPDHLLLSTSYDFVDDGPYDADEPPVTRPHVVGLTVTTLPGSAR